MKISFREVEISDAKMLLDWRTSPEITKCMITDVPYDLEAQKKWIMSSYARKDYYHWVIVCDDTPIGCIYIQNFDRENKCTWWGFYKGADGFSGIGSKIPVFLYNYIFFQLELTHIFTEVMYDNIKAIELYLSYGCRFMPERDRIIQKNGRDILLIALSLLRQDWDAEKYQDNIVSFPTCHWEYSPI